MKEFTYTITDPEGIHARPAGALIKEAAKFTCNITISRDGKEMSAKKIFGVMGLGIKTGNEVLVKLEGEDEEEAYTAMYAFFQNNL